MKERRPGRILSLNLWVSLERYTDGHFPLTPSKKDHKMKIDLLHYRLNLFFKLIHQTAVPRQIHWGENHFPNGGLFPESHNPIRQRWRRSQRQSDFAAIAPEPSKIFAQRDIFADYSVLDRAKMSIFVMGDDGIAIFSFCIYLSPHQPAPPPGP
jgi:hypothetical protein